MELEQDNGLLRIDFEKGQLITEKRTYYVQQHLSVARYCEYQIIEKELGYGTTFQGIFTRIQKALHQFNALKFVDGVITLTDLVKGISNIEKREPAVLKLAALFLNYEGENVKVYSKDIEEQKIQDWKEAGIDMHDFFHLVLNMVPGFLKIYAKVSQSITEALKLPPEEAEKM